MALVAGTASASVWTNGGGDRAYTNPLNWDNGIVPVHGTQWCEVYTDTAGQGPIVTSDEGAYGLYAAGGDIDIRAGGDISTKGPGYIGAQGETAVVDVAAGGTMYIQSNIYTTSKNLMVGHGLGSNGTLNINGGDVRHGRMLQIGVAEGTGEIQPCMSVTWELARSISAVAKC